MPFLKKKYNENNLFLEFLCMKVAILHEMLVKLGGAEKVVENFMKLFPEADIFTSVFFQKDNPIFI